MAITVGIEHTTSYRYDRPVAHDAHLIRLHPAPHARTPIRDYLLTIRPDTHRVYWQADPFGNRVARAVFTERLYELDVEVRLLADMTVVNPFDFFVEAYAERFPFAYDRTLLTELGPYFEIVERGPRLSAWLAGVDRRPCRIVDFLVAVNARVQRDVAYSIRMEAGVQTCEETLERALGSCRDSAWLLVQILRHLGIAARFASGYLVQLAADQKALDGPSGPEADFTDLHAWAEAYVPGAGWIGLDPTSGLFAGEGHIPLACTPDPVSAAPITGAIEPCEVTFAHGNVVRRVHEDPRVTKPYGAADWAAIRTLGRAVDAELAAGDVRLTLGGEPTFVSIDDMESPQWNTEALGPHKWERAVALLRRLRTAFAPGALLHFGQGKWYPGEPLPRWALGCHWRRDGRPLWVDDALVAGEARDYGVGPDDARRFARRLAERLGVDADVVAPACEDWAHHLWREACRPIDLDPLVVPWAPDVRDDASAALARGLDRPVGHVLPLAWDAWRGAWHSAPWGGDGDVVRLLPGSSPMGLRLPLDRLPAGVEIERDEIVLAPPAWRVHETEPGYAADAASGGMMALPTRARPEVVHRTYRTSVAVPHTACCLEVRGGRLCVFLPPVPTLDAYAALVAALEATAAELGIPVLLEGYEPPPSPELRTIRVTPDPGVIEVNVHPASSWDELEATTVTLYEAARLERLGTEKFMVDGRHTGTGGGNHVTLGGATVMDSPFLRRPDLLRSLVTYWQHHPALSYLFSGLFIGPTSQAPRVDEAGTAELVELERSLAEIERATEPRVVDRALRSFLCDLTGNTHRTEFSIDKLWSADGASGRQGLLELRAFEMPPHAQMSLAQMLLVRSLVAWFWKAPYRHPLVRWGTTLTDRFLLPHYVWADLLDVVAGLERAGYPFRAAWYAPFFEFRFPVCGRATVEGVELELRTALEPWPVLGEDATATRQSRVVDSAVERVQLTCRGLDPARHVVTCNGRRLPLTATGVPGELVAGVRFTAWQVDAGMHPTIGAHTPLVFDVVDRRLGRAVGGCAYHASHPGGRAYDTLPVNAFEAEARRITRFSVLSHTGGDAPGRREPPPEPFDPDFRTTLDLRRLPA